MALDSRNIRIAGTGAIYKAPVGSTAPTDSTTALDAAFVNLGFAKDGFEINQEYKTKDVEAWQTREVVLQFPTSLSRTVSFESIESNKASVALAWNNATITKTTGGVYSMTLPASYVNTEFALVLDMSDGTTSQRIYFPRCTLNALPKVTAGRTDIISYQFEIQVLAPTDNSASVVIYGVDSNSLGA